jgi:hypothetical protein
MLELYLRSPIRRHGVINYIQGQFTFTPEVSVFVFRITDILCLLVVDALKGRSRVTARHCGGIAAWNVQCHSIRHRSSGVHELAGSVSCLALSESNGDCRDVDACFKEYS